MIKSLFLSSLKKPRQYDRSNGIWTNIEKHLNISNDMQPKLSKKKSWHLQIRTLNLLTTILSKRLMICTSKLQFTYKNQKFQVKLPLPIEQKSGSYYQKLSLQISNECHVQSHRDKQADKSGRVYFRRRKSKHFR